MTDQSVEGHQLYGMLPAENEPIHTRERKPAVPVAPERVETPGSFSAESLSPQGGSAFSGWYRAEPPLPLERRWFVWLSSIEDLAE